MTDWEYQSIHWGLALASRWLRRSLSDKYTREYRAQCRARYEVHLAHVRGIIRSIR